jgi:hypothetical protein
MPPESKLGATAARLPQSMLLLMKRVLPSEKAT